MGFPESIKSKLGMSRAEEDSDSDPPPAYEDATSPSLPTSGPSTEGFTATDQLQIDAIGYDYNTALRGKTFEIITVHRADTREPEYTSIRLQKSSNSCALVRTTDAAQTPLITTIYRIGPGRPPKLHILGENAGMTPEEAINSKSPPGETVEVKSRSMFSRAQLLDTSLGRFEWRYGSRDEVKVYNANSLLILEKMEEGQSKRGTKVAQLVRNDELRTPGTTKNMGGNGGRLMVDLSAWRDDKKTRPQDAEAFIVASCIMMLKREADRFINNNVAAVS